jgi:hypothetical protein
VDRRTVGVENITILLCNFYNNETYRCPALNGNKIKHVSSTIDCTGEISTFSSTGPHRVPYVLS